MKTLTGVIIRRIAVFAAVIWLATLSYFVNITAASSSPILIVGIQTASQTSASQERIILANVSDKTVSLDSYKLEYLSAQPKNLASPSRTIKLQGMLSANNTFELSSSGYRTDQADLSFSSTLAASGGHLRLVHVAESIVEQDMVGWGTAAYPKVMAASAPKPGELLSRRQIENEYLNTGNNSVDFSEDRNDVLSALVPENTNGLMITELLPDPASPTLDSKDEFIELYNSSSEPINLKGLILKAGPTLDSKHELTDQILQPGEYKALYITETKLALGNSGSKVQLSSSGGHVISDVTYPKALSGSAWAWNGSNWQWTLTPTPGSANNIDAPAVKSETFATAKSKKTSTTKPKSTTKKAATKKSTAVDKAAKKSSKPVEAKPKIHNSVVAGVGSLAVLYGAYEYRQDMASIFRKLRGNRKLG